MALSPRYFAKASSNRVEIHHGSRLTRSCVLSPSVKPAPRSARPAPPSGLSLRLLKTEGRPSDVVAFEEAVVGFFLESASFLGIPKSLAAIYGLCFSSPTPLCFSDVNGRLGLSAGSISQGLRILREVGALKVVPMPHDRREFFAPDMELRKLVSHFLEKRLRLQLERGGGRLASLSQAIPPGANGGAAVLRSRLKSLRDWHRKTRALLPVARTFLKLS